MRFSSFTAIYDSCILYPAPLRDLMMWLALTDLYRAKWTRDIHEEWMRSVLRDRPTLSRAHLERTRELMDAHVRDCLVEQYEALIPALSLPDPNDRHVLAAAIKSGGDVIVTFNLRDFPAAELDKYDIEAQHPDLFITHLLDLNEGAVCTAVKKQRAALTQPSYSAEALLQTLESHGLTETVARLRCFVALL